jgi:hypothetical protein
MGNFAGRDTTRTYSVAFWVRELGERRHIEIDADAVADVLDCLVATPVTKFVGKDPLTGEKRLRTFGRRKPATINRLKSVISSMLSFAQRRRLMPRGWSNPCKEGSGAVLFTLSVLRGLQALAPLLISNYRTVALIAYARSFGLQHIDCGEPRLQFFRR